MHEHQTRCILKAHYDTHCVSEFTVIRKATLQDIPFLLELLRESSDKLLQRSAEEYKEVIGNTWVAVYNDRIVGCATLEIYSSKIAEIRSVAVDKAF